MAKHTHVTCIVPFLEETYTTYIETIKKTEKSFSREH